MKDLVIDGWRCVISRDGSMRNAFHHSGSWYQYNGKTGSLSAGLEVEAPPAVLTWLVKPLLHDAWKAGAAYGKQPGHYDFADSPYLETP